MRTLITGSPQASATQRTSSHLLSTKQTLDIQTLPSPQFPPTQASLSVSLFRGFQPPSSPASITSETILSLELVRSKYQQLFPEFCRPGTLAGRFVMATPFLPGSPEASTNGSTGVAVNNGASGHTPTPAEHQLAASTNARLVTTAKCLDTAARIRRDLLLYQNTGIYSYLWAAVIKLDYTQPKPYIGVMGAIAFLRIGRELRDDECNDLIAELMVGECCAFLRDCWFADSCHERPSNPQDRLTTQSLSS